MAGVSGQVPIEQVEAALLDVAGRLPYPPTPDIAGAVWQRLVREGAAGAASGGRPGLRRAWVGFALATMLVLAVTLAVPEARALVGSFIARIGVITFVLQTPTPTSPAQGPTPKMAPGTSIADWADATTLEEAQRRAGFPIRLPGYPPSLGLPDRVFVQDLGGPAVVLVWLQPGYPDGIRLVLYEMTSNAFAQKIIAESTILTATSVSEQPALWVQGPHVLEFRDPQAAPGESTPLTRRLVDGNVLVWEKAGITYRLEGALTMEEAVHIGQLFIIFLPTATPDPMIKPRPTDTPVHASQVLPFLAGATTLEEAQKKLSFPVRLPEYPPGVGPPDKVFLQNVGDMVLILVWLAPGAEDTVRMALYELPATVRGTKTLDDVTLLATTWVNGQPAEWVTGAHVFELEGGEGKTYRASRRLVSGNVLVWAENGVTYRLETSLPIQEALRIGESLR